MNDEPEQETQELEKQEETHETDVEKSDIEVKDAIIEEEQVEVLVEQTGHEEKKDLEDDEEHVGDETAKKEVIEEPPIVVQDYLDSSILDVKVVSEAELEQYEEKSEISDNLNDQYEETFADIRQQEVVTGSVVGLTDRDVLIDIGFKSEGIVSCSEFEELPEVGQEVDVFIRTFEDRRGNMLLSKEKADFQKRWQEIRDCFENEELITGLITRRIKGGMVVDLGVVQAFLPGSQLDIKPVIDFDEY